VEYRRRLPHSQPVGTALFITLRLHGTLPPHSGRESDTTLGQIWLKQPQIAECVTTIILDGERIRKLYHLLAFVVMPNHVHLLIEPQAQAPKIAQYLKGVSARRSNRLLQRTGQPFWQRGSYDYWVRNSEERDSLIRYIEENPLLAGLVDSIEQWRFSSAFTSSYLVTLAN
jgi:REP element-mobilizing transposase RayT